MQFSRKLKLQATLKIVLKKKLYELKLYLPITKKLYLPIEVLWLQSFFRKSFIKYKESLLGYFKIIILQKLFSLKWS